MHPGTPEVQLLDQPQVILHGMGAPVGDRRSGPAAVSDLHRNPDLEEGKISVAGVSGLSEMSNQPVLTDPPSGQTGTEEWTADEATGRRRWSASPWV